MPLKPRVLFLCTENTCRAQMVGVFLREVAGDRFEIVSAGSNATELETETVEAMGELGIDISAQESKSVVAFLSQKFTYLISLCDARKNDLVPSFRVRFGGFSGTLKTRLSSNPTSSGDERSDVGAMKFVTARSNS